MKQLKPLCAFLLMLIVSVSAFAQNKVTGKVVDPTGEPVIGASVQVKGTSVGSITDMAGTFSVSALQNATLVISYLGYKTQEVILNGRQFVSIALQEDAEQLDEVVVVGYGTMKKASLTSAISSVKGEDVFKDRGINNTTVALQGAVPGLTVTRSNTRPGSEGAEMKIRGDISVNGKSSPLILIDGIAGSLDELNQMDPNDIDNISILKDASAAIYGARSASGVVMATTKRGRKGKTKISYSGSVSTTIDGIKPSITSNEQWLDMFYEAQYQDARAANPNATTHDEIMSNYNWWIFGTGSVLQGVDANGKSYERDVLWKALRTGETLTLNNSGKILRYEPGHYLMDELYGQATSTKHSISVSGADDRFGYMASLGYADNQSQLKVADDGEKKYSGRLNMDFQASRLLKLETGMSYEVRNISMPSTDVGAGWYDPWLWPIQNEEGNYYDTFGNRNPIAGLTNGGRINTDYTTFRGTVKATLDLSDLLDGLSVSATGGYKKVGKNTQTSKNKIQYYDWANNITTNRQATAELTEKVETWESLTFGGFVNYERLFNNVHSVSAMIGMTAEEQAYKNIEAGRRAGQMYEGSNLVDLNTMISGTNNIANGGQNEWAFLSYITRLKYIFSNKYLIEALARRDGSSRLYPEQRWKNFYSLSGGWVVTGEEFMKNIEWLNHLKIRYNYGKTGSVEGIDNYERFATVSTGYSYFGTALAGQTSLYLGGMTSATRTWETINSHNVGFDFGLLKNRLSGSFDYFTKANKGMFIDVTYPLVLGASAPKSNNGKFKAKGWEFTLNWRDKIQNVTYNIGGWIADAKSKVADLKNNENVPEAGKNSNRLIGKPREAIYVWNTEGIFQTQTEVDAYYAKYYWTDATQTAIKSGNILPAPSATSLNRLRPGARILTDSDGDGAITNDDLVYAGDAAPHYTFGFNLGVEWKGFDIKAFFQGVGKQIVLRTGNLYAPWVTNYTLQNTTYMGKQWSDVAIPSLLSSSNAAEINTKTQYTIASRDNNFNRFNYLNKDVSVQNSNYVRLKSLVIGYTLPKALTRKASLDRVRVYFSGDDLWEWTKISDGYDPEYGEATNNTFPFSRLLSVGFEISF